MEVAPREIPQIFYKSYKSFIYYYLNKFVQICKISVRKDTPYYKECP